MGHSLLVTGGTGFVGGAVGRLLRGCGDDLHVRVLVRSEGGGGAGYGETVRGDLSDADSLRGCCDGIDVVLHLASHIGDDPDACRRTNVEGTRALVAEARRAGVGRIVQLSTAAVYGSGPHRGPREGELAPQPGSATSRSRWESEGIVLEAGGTVVRPYYVYGPGDRWVVPTVAGLLRRLPALPGDGGARLSLIAVDDLARCLVGLARGTAAPGQVFHAVHPEPVSVGELFGTVAELLGLPGLPGDAGFVGPELLTTDRWYDGTALWETVGERPGDAFAVRMKELAYRDWYRDWCRDGSWARGAVEDR